VTDDEAFIRAVVDSPGDDTPRLVYADWLDDHADPRGPYLRAEVELARTGTVACEKKLLSLAPGLDAIWRARVTRPPFGVCCDYLYFTNSGPRLTRDDLSEIGRWKRVRLPDDYTAFLLNYNGGIPHLVSDYLRPPSGVVTIAVSQFYVFRPGGNPRERGSLHGEVDRYWNKSLPGFLASKPSRYSESDVAWYHDFIPVADTADGVYSVLLGVYGENRGRVQLIDWTVHPVSFSHVDSAQVGGSFAGLLAQVIPTSAA